MIETIFDVLQKRIVDVQSGASQTVAEIIVERNQLKRELAAARMEAEANQAKATGLARVLGDVTEEKERLASELAHAKAEFKAANALMFRQLP